MQQDVQTDATCNIQQCWEFSGQQGCVCLHAAYGSLNNRDNDGRETTSLKQLVSVYPVSV